MISSFFPQSYLGTVQAKSSQHRKKNNSNICMSKQDVLSCPPNWHSYIFEKYEAGSKKKTSSHANNCVPAEQAITVITWGAMVAERLSSVATAQAKSWRPQVYWRWSREGTYLWKDGLYCGHRLTSTRNRKARLTIKDKCLNCVEDYAERKRWSSRTKYEIS